MENHKRILGILFVVTGALQILILLVVSAFLSALFNFAQGQADDAEGREVLRLLAEYLPYLPGFLIIVVALPSLIAGIGLLTKQSWGLTLGLVVGCLKLLSFPVGTCIGVYAIWIYSENSKPQPV